MSKNLSPDEWVEHMEELERQSQDRAKQRIKESDHRSLCPILDAPSRPNHVDEIPDEELETTWWRPRFHFYDRMSKSSPWTHRKDEGGRFQIIYVERDGIRFTVACSCGNRRCEPDNLCPHRAYTEYRHLDNKGLVSKYDDLPDEWDLTYDEFKQNNYNFDWELVE